METKITSPQSDISDSNGNQNKEKLNSSTEMDKRIPDENDKQQQKEKGTYSIS